jgi:hypothetical protein
MKIEHLKREGAVCYANKLLQYLHELQVVTIEVFFIFFFFDKCYNWGLN